MFDQAAAKSTPGRPVSIDDGRLWGQREFLVGLLESTWSHVGWTLSTIKTVADVPSALQEWEERREQNYLVKTLLRPTDRNASATALREHRKRLRHANRRQRDAYDALEKPIDLFERSFRLIAGQYSESQCEAIGEAIKERARALARFGAEYLALQESQKELQEEVLDYEASFARAEVVDFCLSKRYRLTPLNVANAIAGLPDIGWRQSAKRCGAIKRKALKGQSYEIFEVIQRLVNSNTRRSELVRDAEKWLRSARSNGWDGVAELRRRWYYLSRAIRTVLEQKVQRRKLPFLILQEYWKRRGHPSLVDSAFEEEESIVI